MTKHSLQQPILNALKEQLQRLESVHRPAGERISVGCLSLDRMLSFRRGTLVEYLANAGSGAAALAIIAAREACREHGALVVVDRQLYPPAVNSLGINLTKVIFVRPRTRKDELWALNQSLSCKGVAAVLSWPDKLSDRAYRGLQLAAEHGGALGLFVRPVGVRGHPTWSEVQLLIETLPAVTANRRLRVEVVRCRNGHTGAWVEFGIER